MLRALLDPGLASRPLPPGSELKQGALPLGPLYVPSFFQTEHKIRVYVFQPTAYSFVSPSVDALRPNCHWTFRATQKNGNKKPRVGVGGYFSLGVAERMTKWRLRNCKSSECHCEIPAQMDFPVSVFKPFGFKQHVYTN